MSELERRLADVRDHLEFPPTPSLVEPVMARLPETRRRRLSAFRVAIATGLAVVLLLAVIPRTRSAIADLLGLGGVQIVTVEELPRADVLARPIGVETSLQEARDVVSFEILAPKGYPAPDEVFVDTQVPGGLVSLAYRPGDDSYGLVITQFSGATDLEFAEKAVTPGSIAEEVTVAGEPAFWIEGAPHTIALLDSDGDVREDTTRLVGNTLLFVTDRGVTVRIESGLTLDETLAIARSLRGE